MTSSETSKIGMLGQLTDDLDQGLGSRFPSQVQAQAAMVFPFSALLTSPRFGRSACPCRAPISILSIVHVDFASRRLHASCVRCAPIAPAPPESWGWMGCRSRILINKWSFKVNYLTWPRIIYPVVVTRLEGFARLFPRIMFR